MAAFATDFVTTLSGVGANTNGKVVPLDGALGGAVGVHVLQIDSGQVKVEGTLDGHTWSLLQMTNTTDGTTSSSATASGIYRVEVTGLAGIRTPQAGWTTGITKVVVLPQHG